MTCTTMVGALFLTVAAFVWGRERCKREREKLLALEGLIAFVSYADEQISTFRTPLARIYNDFSNEYFEKSGFLLTMSEKGLESALEHLEGILPSEAMKEARIFASSLGGGFCEGQSALCKYTEKRLEQEATTLRDSLPERLKMYRLLPILFAASVIILLI